MKDFLEHLINRNLESKPIAVQPRLPSWYELQTVAAAPPLSAVAQGKDLDTLDDAPQFERNEQKIAPAQSPTVHISSAGMLRPQAPSEGSQEHTPPHPPKTQTVDPTLRVQSPHSNQPMSVLPTHPTDRPSVGSETPVLAQLPAGHMPERRSLPLQSEQEVTASNPAKETQANLLVSIQPQTAHALEHRLLLPAQGEQEVTVKETQTNLSASIQPQTRHTSERRLLPTQGEQDTVVNGPAQPQEIRAAPSIIERPNGNASTITPKLPEIPTTYLVVPSLVRVAEEEHELTRIVEKEQTSQTDSHRGSEEHSAGARTFVTDLRHIDQTASTPLVVRIQIGRVDVRITHPGEEESARAGQQKKHVPRSPRVSLDAYLKERATTPSTGEKR